MGTGEAWVARGQAGRTAVAEWEFAAEVLTSAAASEAGSAEKYLAAAWGSAPSPSVVEVVA